MATIIEFRFPTENFALKETLDTHPEAHIEIERVVADDPDRITPYVWVRTDDFDAFEAVLEDDPTVEDMMTDIESVVSTTSVFVSRRNR